MTRQIKTKEFYQPIEKQMDIVVIAPRLASRTTHGKGVVRSQGLMSRRSLLQGETRMDRMLVVAARAERGEERPRG